MMDLQIIHGEVVKNLKTVQNLEIRYFRQENQGKMQAINNLMEYVTGELVMDCDSDDYFVEEAFEKIFNHSESLLRNCKLYAIVLLKNEDKNKLSGNQFTKEDEETTMFDLYFRKQIIGEKILIFNTKIRKKYKHELQSGEKFITEARMYHKMDLNYRIKCYNDVVIEGEYLLDGYTNNLYKTFINSPNGYFEYFKEILQKNMKGVIFKKRIYAIKHYILFKYLSKNKVNLKEIKDILNRFLYVICYIPGQIKSKIIVEKDGKREYFKK